MLDRFLADRDLVTREEFDAARAMAQKAREENEALKTELASLSDRLARLETASNTPKEAGGGE
jgi:BMFP domain-containing protein YqiC